MKYTFFRAAAFVAAVTAIGMLVPSLLRAQSVDTAAIKALTAAARKDTAKSKIKPYKEVVPASAKTSRGFFLIHKVDDKYLVEIPDSLLGRDMLVENRIVRAPGGMTPAKLLFGGLFSYAG